MTARNFKDVVFKPKFSLACALRLLPLYFGFMLLKFIDEGFSFKYSSEDIGFYLLVSIFIMSLWCLFKFINYQAISYTLTEDRLIENTNFFGQRIRQIVLSNIDGIEVSKDVYQVMFGIANIRINGTLESPSIELFDLENAIEIYSLINSKLDGHVEIENAPETGEIKVINENKISF